VPAWPAHPRAPCSDRRWRAPATCESQDQDFRCSAPARNRTRTKAREMRAGARAHLLAASRAFTEVTISAASVGYGRSLFRVASFEMTHLAGSFFGMCDVHPIRRGNAIRKLPAFKRVPPEIASRPPTLPCDPHAAAAGKLRDWVRPGDTRCSPHSARSCR